MPMSAKKVSRISLSGLLRTKCALVFPCWSLTGLAICLSKNQASKTKGRFCRPQDFHHPFAKPPLFPVPIMFSNHWVHKRILPNLPCKSQAKTYTKIAWSLSFTSSSSLCSVSCSLYLSHHVPQSTFSLPICLHLCVSIRLSVHLYICAPLCQFVCSSHHQLLLSLSAWAVFMHLSISQSLFVAVSVCICCPTQQLFTHPTVLGGKVEDQSTCLYL